MNSTVVSAFVQSSPFPIQPMDLTKLVKWFDRLPLTVVEHILEYNVQHRVWMRNVFTIIENIALNPYYYTDARILTGYVEDEIVETIQDLKYELVQDYSSFARCLCCFEFKTVADIWRGLKKRHPEDVCCHTCIKAIGWVRGEGDGDGDVGEIDTVSSRLNALNVQVAQDRAYLRLRGLLDDDDEDEDYDDDDAENTYDAENTDEETSLELDEIYEQNEREAEYQEYLLQLE